MKPYSGYHLQPEPDSDTLLTDVSPGSPCGEYLRRYWQPFLLSSELRDVPLPVRLFGEDLVVFRDRSNSIGLLHRHCATAARRWSTASPSAASAAATTAGNTTSTARSSKRRASRRGARSRTAYVRAPIRSTSTRGLIFAYLGPPEKRPTFPVYDVFESADYRLVPGLKHVLPCNWLQIEENCMDPVHNAFLHAIMSSTGQFSDAFKILPVLDYPQTPLGFLAMATRKVGRRVFVRASDMMLPNVGQFPSGGNTAEHDECATRPGITRWVVPVDNENSFYIGLGYVNSHNSRQRPVSVDSFGVGKMPVLGQDRRPALRGAPARAGDYDAVVSQGAIVNRKSEHLGTSDRGVALLRRLLTQAIRAVQEGRSPETPTLMAKHVRTYAHTVVMPCPAVIDLADFGRRAAAVFIETASLPPAERETMAAEKIRRLITQGETHESRDRHRRRHRHRQIRRARAAQGRLRRRPGRPAQGHAGEDRRRVRREGARHGAAGRHHQGRRGKRFSTK